MRASGSHGLVAALFVVAACSRAASVGGRDDRAHAGGSGGVSASTDGSTSAEARTIDEVASPPSFVPRVHDGLPAPDGGAAQEDVPAGATCRLGSSRFGAAGSNGSVWFATPNRLLLDPSYGWVLVDTTTGAHAETIAHKGVTAGVSASGTCAAVAASEGEVAYHALPSGERVATRTYAEDAARDIVPADDCSIAIHEQSYDAPCVTIFGKELAPSGEVCADPAVVDVALSGDGRRVALATEGDEPGGVHVFDTHTRERIALVPRVDRKDVSVALARDGSLLAVAEAQGVRIVAVPGGSALVHTALPERAYVVALVFSPQAKRLAVTFRRQADDEPRYGLVVIDVASGKPLFTQFRLPPVGGGAFSPDGTTLAYVVKESIRVVDAFTGEDRGAPRPIIGRAGSAIAPAGDRAVTSSTDHLTVWNTADCTRIADHPNRPMLEDLLMGADGTWALGFHDESIVRVDLATGARRSLSLGPFDARDSQVLAPDGRTAVIGLEDRKRRQRLVFVDTARMKERGRITLPKVGPIGALLFAPTGKTVLAVAPGGLAHGDLPTGDTSVIAVDVASGRVGSRFTIDGVAQAYSGAVLERGRVITINDGYYEPRRGDPLARERRTLFATSDDHRTILWAHEGGVFLWPADEPLPSSPTITPWNTPGRLHAGANAFMGCGEQSCIVARAPPRRRATDE